MFYFRLARALGMTVKRLLYETDSRELSEWEAYDRLEPIDHAKRAEVSAGIIAANVAAPHRDPNHDAPKASDFMPDYGSDWRQQAADDVQRVSVEDKVDDAVRALGLSWEN